LNVENEEILVHSLGQLSEFLKRHYHLNETKES